MKILLFFFVLFFYANSYAQESCTNGMDDDGDGKIDLNDPDCICVTPDSRIPNPSFEEYRECPDNASQLNRAIAWVQATAATTDYYNVNQACDFATPNIRNNGLLPPPDGTGFTGALFLQEWKEYLGACLIEPMKTGERFLLTLDVASTMTTRNGGLANNGIINYSDTEITVYGTSNCNYLPVDNTTRCPTEGSGNWFKIGSVVYSPKRAWEKIQISITAPKDIAAIMMGPPCFLNSSYPSGAGNPTPPFPYILFDNLIIDLEDQFGATIKRSGDFCDGNLSLTGSIVNANGSYTLQWYKDGVAIPGANNTTYQVPPKESGDYTLAVIRPNLCTASVVEKVTPHIISDTPSVSFRQPDCGESLGEITINTPAAEYSYTGGVTWTTRNSFLLAPGFYNIKTRTIGGCESEAVRVFITNPPASPSPPLYSVTEPSCDINTGSITISTIADEYSFDNGGSWQNSPTKDNLAAGEYFLKTRNLNGCSSQSQSATISPAPPSTPEPVIEVEEPESCDNLQTGIIRFKTPQVGEFSIDGGKSFQLTNTFSNLKPGYYTIMAKDLSTSNPASCYSIPKIVELLAPLPPNTPDGMLKGIPSFFSPNGDGKNDVWKPSDYYKKCYPNAEIVVFDRYGRVLKKFLFDDAGWDGTFNGVLMTTDDYWFSIKLRSGEEVLKGNFSLIK